MTYEEQEKEFAVRTHDIANRTIDMESKDNVWKWRKLIEDNGVAGKLTVELWGRDCDQFESTSLKEINASLDSLATIVEDMSDNAEGAWSLKVMTQDELATWKQQSVDHRAEQLNF